jgi:hypothetical protein
MSEELLKNKENANDLGNQIGTASGAQPEQAVGTEAPAADLKSFKPDGREESYVELERKLTQMGQENSELKRFYEDVLPALKTIDEDPRLKEEVLKKLYPDQYPKESQPSSVNVQQTPPAQPVVPDINKVKEEILRSVDDKTSALREQLDYERNLKIILKRITLTTIC